MALIHKKGTESAVVKGRENLDLMIDWLAMFQYSTPRILSKLIGSVGAASEARIRNRLVNGGWATLMPTPGSAAGFRIRTRAKGQKATSSVPYILVASDSAISLADFRCNFPIPSKFHSRLVGDYIHHDLCAQLVAALVVSSNRECVGLSKHSAPLGAKHYDAAICVDGKFFGIEVERSRKDPSRELWRAFDNIARSFTGFDSDGVTKCQKYEGVVYCFEDEALKDLYKKYFVQWCNHRTLDEKPNLKYLDDPRFNKCFKFRYYPEFANERWT